MGLTIHYSLRSTARSPKQIGRLVEQIRQRATTLPFKTVGPVVEFEGDAADFQQLERSDPNRWLLIQSSHHVEVGNRCYSVPPSKVIAFCTNPGDGCEPANFGLARYPGLIEVDGKKVRTGAAGWRWGSFCKTEYASNGDCGGMENFIRCHLSVIALLDAAKAIGILGHVNDEGDYWERQERRGPGQTGRRVEPDDRRCCRAAEGPDRRPDQGPNPGLQRFRAFGGEGAGR